MFLARHRGRTLDNFRQNVRPGAGCLASVRIAATGGTSDTWPCSFFGCQCD